MIRRWLGRGLERFGRRYDYDTRYLQEVVDADLRGGFELIAAQRFLAYDFGAPARLYHAAKVRSVRRADCGPCLALCVRMAGSAGITAAQLLPALQREAGHPEAGVDAAGPEPDVPAGRGGDPDLELVLAFTDAVIDNGPELPGLADAVRTRFGERTRAGLAAAIIAGQFYPLLKRALGHAATCEPVLRDLLAAAAANGSQPDPVEDLRDD